ncbi:MAG TPA: hypothetical protein VMM12_16895 [Longimicrobiales bacterium]|nr:hypothetical protein [Longimicrobiales bacterium]
MRDPGRWLDARRPAAPAPLRAVLERALEGAPAADAAVEERLADAALATLRQLARHPGGRESAPALLAADALLTYACEAAAERGPAALEALTSGLSPERFDSLLEEGAS